MQLNVKIKNKNTQSAFTIVELLVVIVIIGILATIVIIFYIGTHDKAIDGALQSDLKGASTVLELDKANGDLYPTTKENANDGKGLKSSNGTTLDYAYNSGNNSYCLTASKEGRSYYINSEGRVPAQGGCPVGNVASFSRTWGGTSYDWGHSVTKTNDGGYIITGGTVSFGGGGGVDMFLAKFTATGELSWNKTWGGTGEEIGLSITQTSDGGYAITGGTKSFGSGAFDAFLAKFTATGELSWSRTWGGTAYDQSQSVVQTSDSGYIIAGQSVSFGANSSSDAFLAKFTATGELSWSRTWGGTNEDWSGSVAQTNDGGYVIVGETYSFGGGDDAFLAKFTAAGELSWSRTWGGTNDDLGHSIIQTSDGGCVIAGNTKSFGVGNNDAFLAKFTAAGELSWSRTWGGFDNDYDYSIVRVNDGGYVITGETNSFGAGNSDVYFAKFTADGSMSDCPSSICKNPSANTTSPTAITTNPIVNTTNPTATVTSPLAAVTAPTATLTIVTPTAPLPSMTIIFSSQELYIAYPGERQTTCKEWTVPNGKQIKGFQVSQATESSFDYFTVSLDGVEKYKKSGNLTDKYVDTSSTPGVTLKACISTDGSGQQGYGGQVTGVVYN